MFEQLYFEVCPHCFALGTRFALHFKQNGLINIVFPFSFTVYSARRTRFSRPLALVRSVFAAVRLSLPIKYKRTLLHTAWRCVLCRKMSEPELTVPLERYNANALMTQLFNYTNALLISWIFHFFFFHSKVFIDNAFALEWWSKFGNGESARMTQKKTNRSWVSSSNYYIDVTVSTNFFHVILKSLKNLHVSFPFVFCFNEMNLMLKWKWNEMTMTLSKSSAVCHK